MKMVFHYCKFFAICVFTFYFLFSCTSSKNLPPEDKKKLVIRITGSNSTTDSLTMKDEKGDPAENFQAWSGQKIKWDIEDANVKSIKGIYPKDTSQNIFSEPPKKLFWSKNWQGKLKETTVILIEYYNIDWMDDTTHQLHKFDPKIQLNPAK